MITSHSLELMTKYILCKVYKPLSLSLPFSHTVPLASFVCDPCISINYCWRQNIPPRIHHHFSFLWIKDVSPCRYLHCRTHRWPLDTLWRGEWDGVSRERPGSSDADDGKPTPHGTITAKPNATITATIKWFLAARENSLRTLFIVPSGLPIHTLLLSFSLSHFFVSLHLYFSTNQHHTRPMILSHIYFGYSYL
jgi:hypothetical protein